MRFLLEPGIQGIRFTWFDTGNLDALNKAKANLKPSEDAVILEKENEAIWFVNDQVIKFSIDEEFIRNRIKRSELLQPYVPKIVGHTANMYAYKLVKGTVMSRRPNVVEFRSLLDVMEGFWQPAKLTESESADFNRRCMAFYKDKTLTRVKNFFARFEAFDMAEAVNGTQLPKIQTLLESQNWEWIAQGHPVRFHGDLHFENILVTTDTNRPFMLLDWRQDFGGGLEHGDIYYDLAKLAHGFIVSHQLIEQNLFEIRQHGAQVNFDFLRKNSLTECLLELENWCDKSGFSFKKVQIITTLIFLNIAELHHYPYSKFLFYLGKYLLFTSSNKSDV